MQRTNVRGDIPPHTGAHGQSLLFCSPDETIPLSNAFTPAYFETLVQSCSPKLSVKTVLATEQRIPGLGNGCLQDILFNARIHPMRKLESLDTRHCNALYASIRSTLDTMPRAGGRDTEKDLFGAPGGYTTLLSKKTLKNPCPLCGEMIARKPYLGGNVYFCPQCQPTE